MDPSSDNFFIAIQAWDWKSIFYSIIASIIFALAAKTIGAARLKAISKKFTRHRAIKKYKSTLKDECSSLIAIGRRNGFDIQDVYVELDLTKSDLNSSSVSEAGNNVSLYGIKKSYVIVGGPGAGKSTTVKKIILDKLNFEKTLPFLIRLREYNGYSSVEECLTEKLREAGIPEPKQFLKDELEKGTTCVLDGLDEVRPHLRDEICQHINAFYAKHFVDQQNSKLIVSCRKEAYRSIPLDIPEILEVRPLTDEQIIRFAERWPLGYPKGKSKDTFWRDLGSADKILQLARSPLLLIGGLMQYTESNQGIPEERFEYLKRVANWLVADWATAQGHPPDPNRPVYDRVLPKIAFQMQRDQISELKIERCISMLRDWLPAYGYNAEEAESIIESIATKTGILVREGGNNIVFAQFGLQEYFSSLETISTVSAVDISQLQPTSWWRETILLTVAQLRNPSELLDALFSTSPLLAVSAVSECPTPSIEMQQRAIEVCLSFIDATEKEVGGAAITLLRKLKGTQEASLIREFEKRLSCTPPNPKTLSLVGLSLATAGTPRATNLLAEYPEIWDICLKEVTYLSTSFENLLVEWIEKGDAQQSATAIDMIVTRLSVDRTKQLLKILPNLRAEQAEHLASSILITLFDDEEAHFSAVSVGAYKIISECAPYIKSDEHFKKTEDTYRSKNRYSYHYGFRILTERAIAISRSKESITPSQLLKIIYNAEKWSSFWRGAVIFSLTTLFTLTCLMHDLGYSFSDLIYTTIIAVFLIAISFSKTPPPWIESYHSSSFSFSSAVMFTSVFLLGILFLHLTGVKIDESFSRLDTIAYATPLLMIVSAHLSTSHRIHFTPTKSYFRHTALTWSGFIYSATILGLMSLESKYPSNSMIRPIAACLSIAYLTYLIAVSVSLVSDWRKLR
ncbi:NACHT domain-containing protein [Pseudomonas mosselii]|uniref:NACHT domain-containing protein n=1 Tax=Pseudomonas mosselii TaxID=78327 RepID=UPI002DB99AE3|nr:NACHT domain-containing protein [Pseudomonas mosselii]MEB5932651.1 NACHT domain-containing protein [Pseudomonas mosselii]